MCSAELIGVWHISTFVWEDAWSIIYFQYYTRVSEFSLQKCYLFDLHVATDSRIVVVQKSMVNYFLPPPSVQTQDDDKLWRNNELEKRSSSLLRCCCCCCCCWRIISYSWLKLTVEWKLCFKELGDWENNASYFLIFLNPKNANA